MVHHLTTGKKGEELAEKFLRGQGYEILSRNVHTEGGEIDIIARDGETVVFVEVKARSKRDGFVPSDRIDHAKVERLQGAAQAWLSDQAEELPARIDVIGVCEGEVVEHFEDISV